MDVFNGFTRMAGRLLAGVMILIVSALLVGSISAGADVTVFHAATHGNYELYTRAQPHYTTARLTYNDAVDMSPSRSPDGRNILFISNRDGSLGAYVMAADGSGEARRVVDGARSAVWAPNGNIAALRIEPVRIVFHPQVSAWPVVFGDESGLPWVVVIVTSVGQPVARYTQITALPAWLYMDAGRLTLSTETLACQPCQARPTPASIVMPQNIRERRATVHPMRRDAEPIASVGRTGMWEDRAESAWSSHPPVSHRNHRPISPWGSTIRHDNQRPTAD